MGWVLMFLVAYTFCLYRSSSFYLISEVFNYKEVDTSEQ